jgi:hypothetical protein
MVNGTNLDHRVARLAGSPARSLARADSAIRADEECLAG